MLAKRFTTLLISILFISFTLQRNVTNCMAMPTSLLNTDTKNELELKDELEKIYNLRSNCFVTGDPSILSSLYDASTKYGTWALEHEVKRVKYLKNWSAERGIKFTKVKSEIRGKKIRSKSGNNARLSVEETYNFEYVYENDLNPVVNSFGVGIRHTVSMVNKNNKWMINTDWYTDCFEDALASYNANINKTSGSGIVLNIANCPKNFDINSSGRYNRLKAIAYADKYCGAANGTGNNFKYNSKYKDFTGIGGDCTNFASQVLGDKEAGGLKFDGTWFCNYSVFGNSQGSHAFVNADGFKNYLIYSGKGVLLKKGTFKTLAIPNDNTNCAVVQKMDLGDLVCYAKKSDMNHFAVVTSWDSHGYPLVNSHTTDRYHVPWDLGWGDDDITFYLIHIR